MLLSEASNPSPESPPIRQHWTRVAQAYHQTESPLHPSGEDIAIMERLVDRAAAHLELSANKSTPNALLLGMTPDIATMAWPEQTNLLAIDSSLGMLQTVWPGDRPGKREAKLGDWVALPVADGTCAFVVGDGSLNCVVFPDVFRQVADSVWRVLSDDGVFILRVYVQPENPRPTSQLFHDLVAGRFHTFDGFKFLLCMALVDEQFNVAVQDVWHAWRQAQVDEQAIFSATGWSAAKFDTIAHYQHSNMRFCFPTLAAFESILAQKFEIIDMAVPSYPLGECCPILMLRKRRDL